MQKTVEPQLCPHPFSRAYWRQAAAELTRLRSLVTAALLCALAIALERIYIPVLSNNLRVMFSFPVVALCSMITGPVMAIPCALLVDLVGIMLSPDPFFPGYTLTAVLTALVYAFFLYRAKPSFTRVLLAKGIINGFCNVLLGSVWNVLLRYDGNFGMFGYLAALSGAKNLLLLPLEVFIICALLRALRHPLRQMGVLPDGVSLSYTKTQFAILAAVCVLSVALIVPFVYWYDSITAFLKGLF